MDRLKHKLGIARAKRDNRMAALREITADIEELDKEIERLNLQIMEKMED